MGDPQGSGEVYIDILLDGGNPVFTEKDNTTQGAVVFELTADGFVLKAKRGTYTFYYQALNFEFHIDAVTWESSAHRNLAWIRPNDDPHFVAMSNLNFVSIDQIVDFLLNPADEFANLFQRPIDPTVLNNPDPPLALARREEIRKAVAA
jgi:hypothetical protein